jgi:hypothetical protein
MFAAMGAFDETGLQEHNRKALNGRFSGTKCESRETAVGR